MKTNLVLLVDDEPNVRNSLSRELLEMDVCEVLTAQNGEEGLKVLRKNPKIAVIVSDYRMPGMDGIKFLTEAQRIVPDTTRIMLTGAADLEMAIEAVNSGRIFRFLLKPCPTEVFLNAIKASIRQNQLILGEREFLTKTLNGSIQILIDVLAAIDPESFAHAHRLRQLAHHLAVRLKLEQTWDIDLAALLSQIGSVTIPYEIMLKSQKGFTLNEQELSFIENIPKMGQHLIQNIPGFEKIAIAIRCQNIPFEPEKLKETNLAGENIPIVGRILKIVIDYDRLIEKKNNVYWALQEMYERATEYDPTILEVFGSVIQDLEKSSPEDQSANVKGAETIDIEGLKPGMMLVNDVYDPQGRLIITKGTLITEILRYRLHNYFISRAITKPLVVTNGKASDSFI